MATIQSLLNQAIGTAGVMAGLYAHSPEGQRKAKIKELTSAYETIDKAQSIADEPVNETEIEVAEQIGKKKTRLAEQLFELSGSEQHYQQYREAVSADPTRQFTEAGNAALAREKAARRAEERAAQIERQRENMVRLREIQQQRNTYGGL